MDRWAVTPENRRLADEQPALLPDPFTVGRWRVEPRGSAWLDAPSVGAGGRRIAYERWHADILLLERSDTGTR